MAFQRLLTTASFPFSPPAARCGAINCVRELHSRGAALDSADWGGFTPLINAAWRGDARMMRWLIDAGADLTLRGSSQGRGPFTAAEWALRRGHPQLLKLLEGGPELHRAEQHAAMPHKRRAV